MSDRELEELWEEIWSLLEDGQSEAAVKRALAALNSEGELPELRYLLGVALLDVAEIEAAITELEQAAKLAPEWPEARSALAWANFRLCRFAAATEHLVTTLELDPADADAHQLRGLLAERAGDDSLALVAFAEARRLAPDRFPEPYELDEDEFLEIAQAVVAEIEDPIKTVLQETAFFVQPFPAEELLTEADPPFDPQILGLFVGQSLLEQSVADPARMPSTMYLFQHNVERVATSREELEREIRITVLHEIGHHLGLDEDDLEERGLA